MLSMIIHLKKFLEDIFLAVSGLKHYTVLVERDSVPVVMATARLQESKYCWKSEEWAPVPVIRFSNHSIMLD